jgi:hypothetical protein
MAAYHGGNVEEELWLSNRIVIKPITAPTNGVERHHHCEPYIALPWMKISRCAPKHAGFFLFGCAHHFILLRFWRPRNRVVLLWSGRQRSVQSGAGKMNNLTQAINCDIDNAGNAGKFASLIPVIPEE